MSLDGGEAGSVDWHESKLRRGVVALSLKVAKKFQLYYKKGGRLCLYVYRPEASR